MTDRHLDIWTSGQTLSLIIIQAEIPGFAWEMSYHVQISGTVDRGGGLNSFGTGFRYFDLVVYTKKSPNCDRETNMI